MRMQERLLRAYIKPSQSPKTLLGGTCNLMDLKWEAPKGPLGKDENAVEERRYSTTIPASGNRRMSCRLTWESSRADLLQVFGNISF